jgi:CubicO group peptidase (beta-lactamase class C family)
MIWGAWAPAATTTPTTTATTAATPPPTLAELRRAFQDRDLITSRTFGWIFNAGDPPRIVWRDAQRVKELGGDPSGLRVRWFDAQLHEEKVPARGGRWGAVVEGIAPNGTPVRRGLTLYCRPPGFFVYAIPDYAPPVAYLPGPIEKRVWEQHATEISRTLGSFFVPNLNDTAAAAILISGLSESSPLDRPVLSIDSAVARNEDYHLALKLKIENMQSKVRPLDPPAELDLSHAAPVLHAGPAKEAGVRRDARRKIEKLCDDWAKDSGEPFVTLVARHGVIVVHRASGRDRATGKPIDLGYRCPVFSITKTLTSVLFAQFVEQGRVGWDDPVSKIFADYPQNDFAHIPTFRQCLTHTSGLSGHGDWGGVTNPYLENIILNGLDANVPGRKYEYNGNGFELAAKAMEIIDGKSWRRVYRERLFVPLGMSDVPMENASSGAQLTARDLACVAQFLVNRGGYGRRRFLSPRTFDPMLPRKLSELYPGIDEVEGIGMHWMNEKGAGGKSLFGPHTIGHGSLSSSILRVDLDNDLTIVQVRRTGGPRYGEWAAKFYQAVADVLVR